jgi:hypothetical protein
MQKKKKNVAKIISLAAAFLITLVIASLVTNKKNENLTEEMADPSLPAVSFSVEGYTVNRLAGYIDEMDISKMRDTVTPVSASGGADMTIDANGQDLQAVDYQILTLDGEEVLYEGSEDAQTEVNLNMGNVFDQVKEAVLKVTLSWGDDESANYYTRIADASELNAKSLMDFVNNFHTKTFNKSSTETELATYMETSSDEDHTSLQTVTITSSMDQLSWGNLEVEVPEKVSWEIKESNSSYSSILLKYQLTCSGDSGEEDTYNVREFFRVRYTEDRIYLLSYNRTMNQIFNPKHQVFTKSAVQLGITDPDVDYMTNKDGTVVSFVQERELWNYDKENHKISRVFSFANGHETDTRYNYDQHEIRIISMDDDGSTTFMVCGYMNRDEHEGQVGAAIYRFDNSTNCVEEKAFIPSNKSYAIAADELASLIYYNETDNLLYVMVDDVIYRIDLTNNKQEIWKDNLDEGDYVSADDGHILAYQTAGDSEDTVESYEVVNFADGTDYTVNAESDSYIKALGFIEDDFIYGLAKKDDIGASILGEEVFPMSSIRIINSKQKLMKEYQRDDVYILDAEVEDNMITLHRAKKEKSHYISIDNDYITNNEEQDASNISLGTYTTDLKQTQMQLSVADGISNTKPNLLSPKKVIFSNPITLSMEEKESKNEYYVYGNGELVGIYDKAGYAIAAADDCDGVVISSSQSYVWERGNRYLTSSISDFPDITAENGENSLNASIRAVCAYEGNTVDAAAESESGKQLLEILQDGTGGTAMDLTGCAVEEILYIINKQNPVIMLEGTDSAIVIIGYNQSGTVTYYDPAAGKTQTVSQTKLEEMAEKYGNSFVGYFKDDNRKTEE